AIIERLTSDADSAIQQRTLAPPRGESEVDTFVELFRSPHPEVLRERHERVALPELVGIHIIEAADLLTGTRTETRVIRGRHAKLGEVRRSYQRVPGHRLVTPVGPEVAHIHAEPRPQLLLELQGALVAVLAVPPSATNGVVQMTIRNGPAECQIADLAAFA